MSKAKMNIKPDFYEIRIRIIQVSLVSGAYFYIPQDIAQQAIASIYSLEDPVDLMSAAAKGSVAFLTCFSSETHNTVVLGEEILKGAIFELVELDENCEEI